MTVRFSRLRPSFGRLFAALAAGWIWLSARAAGTPATDPAEPAPGLAYDSPRAARSDPWHNGTGSRLRRNTAALEVAFSRGLGASVFGSSQPHDLWLAHLQTGLVLHDGWGRGHFYEGNLEVTGQVYGGWQSRPQDAYLLGLDGGLRYHFATGTRLVPFLSLSLGINLTDMGHPDLDGHFQFNQQYGAGMRWFYRPDLALLAEYRWQHISNADLSLPNRGVNGHLIVLGISRLF